MRTGFFLSDPYNFSVGYGYKWNVSLQNRNSPFKKTDLFAILAVVTVTGRIAVSYTDNLKETLLSGCSGLLSCKCPGRRSDFGDDNALADFFETKNAAKLFSFGGKIMV